MEAADPGAMLAAVASAGAQVRLAVRALAASTDALARIAAEGRPRALVVAGMGGSAIAGDVLAAVAIDRSAAPVSVHRGYVLPSWVGALDLVLAVSCSGETEETLAVAEEAVRRGCRVVGVGAAGSALHELCVQAGAPFLAVDAQGRAPRASLWSLAVPVLAVGAAADVVPDDAVPGEPLAEALDDVAVTCGPAAPFDANPAKALAYAWAATVPMVWGTTPLTGVAAARCAAQLAENASTVSVHGLLPEPQHNQVVALDGPLAGARDDADDLFADRVSADAGPMRLSLVLLRDPDEHPQIARRARVAVELAQDRGVVVHELIEEHPDPLVRFGRLVARIDAATVYLAIGTGIDPSAIDPIVELKRRIAR